MKSLLKAREVAFQEVYQQYFVDFTKEEIFSVVERILKDLKGYDSIDHSLLQTKWSVLLDKTETFNTLYTLLELQNRLLKSDKLRSQLNDRCYNQHRSIAMSICSMYGPGSTSLFGYVDYSLSTFFPLRESNSFIAKGVAAVVACLVESYLSRSIVDDYAEQNIQLLSSRNVHMKDLTNLVYMLQRPYNDALTMEICEENIVGVLRKQQTYHVISLCVEIDTGVEKGEFSPQFLAIVGNDEGVYGLDEVVNVCISNMYGSIAWTNFGYLDKEKPGIIGLLDSNHEGNQCNTYLDDTVCGIVSAACARLAHNHKNTRSKPIY